MPKRKYSKEFKERVVELVRAGRTPESLAEEFGPSVGSIRNWAKQSDLDDGRRKDGLTTEERKEITRRLTRCSSWYPTGRSVSPSSR